MLFCRLVCKVVKENGDEGAGLNGLKLYPQEGFRAGGKEDFEVPQVAELLVHDKALDANPSSPAQDVSKMGVDEVGTGPSSRPRRVLLQESPWQIATQPASVKAIEHQLEDNLLRCPCQHIMKLAINNYSAPLVPF